MSDVNVKNDRAGAFYGMLSKTHSKLLGLEYIVNKNADKNRIKTEIRNVIDYLGTLVNVKK